MPQSRDACTSTSTQRHPSSKGNYKYVLTHMEGQGCNALHNQQYPGSSWQVNQADGTELRYANRHGLRSPARQACQVNKSCCQR
jgi:hypothetical protein